jgi:uncharacterized protein (DUF1501 family)
MTTTVNHGPGAAPDEACCDEGRKAELSRRHLLQLTGTGLAAGGLITATTAADARVAFATDMLTGAPLAAGTATQAPVLVVVSLRGGFDGLSAVVPAGDHAYAVARPDIAVPASALHRVDAMFGLAPGLAPLFPLWTAGKVAAIHAVGQSDPTRSHFEAMAEMERAAPGSSLRTGWIDRSVGALAASGTFTASQVGAPSLPASLYGDHHAMAIESVADLRFSLGQQLITLSNWRKAVATLHQGAAPEVVKPTKDAFDALTTLSTLPNKGQGAGYTNTPIGKALHDVALLVKAGVGLRFATVDMGNWDMHQNVGRPTDGWMARQLKDLATALAGFAGELGPQLNQVTLVTISEFGRRVAQNGSQGLDHGHGNCVLVMGGGVKGGKVYGPWPGLAAGKLDNGDLAGVTDYRDIMAEILTTRFGVGNVRDVFPGLNPKPLGFVTA